MATLKQSILNYAANYQAVSEYLNATKASAATNSAGVSQGDWAKIFFTGDGHIISHGVDYTPTFAGGAKGLVPESLRASEETANPNAKYKFLGNDGTWKELTVAELPIAATINDWSSDTLFTSQQIHDHFNAQMQAVEAMRFLGVLNSNDDIKALASDGVSQGDTYRIGAEGDYAGIHCQPGDLLICVKDSATGVTGDDLVTKENGYWTVVETNINGTIEHTINGTKYQVYSNNIDSSTDAFTIYAPSEAGEAGNILLSTGNTPSWGKLALNSKDSALDETLQAALVQSMSSTITPDGFTYTTLDGTSHTVGITNAEYAISISGVAGSVKEKLTLSDGLHFQNLAVDAEESYNGSLARQIALSPATDAVIGGIIVDNGAASRKQHSIDDLKNKPTLSVNTDGVLYITKDNIAAALGFVPGSTDNVYSYSLITSGSKEGKANATSTSNPFLNLTSVKENDTNTNVVSHLQLIGGEGLTVASGESNGDYNINFTLNTATTTTLGGIKVGYTTSNNDRKYAVQLDGGNAYVYVPWEDEDPAFSTIKVTSGGTTTNVLADATDGVLNLIAGTGITIDAVDSAETPNQITISSAVYDIVNTTTPGLAPVMVYSNVEIPIATGMGYKFLSYKDGDSNPTWNSLPAQAFSDTWRKIQVKGTDMLLSTPTINEEGTVTGTALNFVVADGSANKIDIVGDASGTLSFSAVWRDIKINNTSIADNSVNFMHTDDIMIATDATADACSDIGFVISWYNLETNNQEIV